MCIFMVRSLPQPLTLDLDHRATGPHTCFRWSFPPYMILQMEPGIPNSESRLQSFQHCHTAFRSWVADCSFACQPRRSTKLRWTRAGFITTRLHQRLYSSCVRRHRHHRERPYTLTKPTSLHGSRCSSLPEMSGRSDARLTCLYCTRRYSRKSVSVSCDVTRVGQRC